MKKQLTICLITLCSILQLAAQVPQGIMSPKLWYGYSSGRIIPNQNVNFCLSEVSAMCNTDAQHCQLTAVRFLLVGATLLHYHQVVVTVGH